MKLTTASILELLNEDQQYDLYKQLRAKFGLVKTGEPVYYVFNSGYTYRLIEDTADKSRLKSHVREWFDEYELEPVFIKDNLWGEGIWLLEKSSIPTYEATRITLDKLKEKNYELYQVVQKSGDGCICFRRTETDSLFQVMNNLDYCNMFGTEGQVYDFVDDVVIVIESVDAESG